MNGYGKNQVMPTAARAAAAAATSLVVVVAAVAVVLQKVLVVWKHVLVARVGRCGGSGMIC